MENIVRLCQKIADKAHQGQFRKFGEVKGRGYIVHPERVAACFPDDPTLASIAWLHDVIEDTGLTEKDLKDRGVLIDIVNSVKTLSKVESENYLDFILRIKRHDLAIPVKIADIRDNMRDLKEGSLKDKYRLALHILEEQ